MKKLLYFILALGLWLAFACKKEEKPVHSTVSAEMKAWAVFSPGSYWIYQNDSTYELDSVYVIKNDTFTKVGYSDGETHWTAEEIKTYMRNSKNYLIVISTSSECHVYEGDENEKYSKSFEFLYLKDKNEFFSPTGKPLTIIDSLYLNGQKYNNIVKYLVDCIYSGSETNPESNENIYYAARNYWIIKKIETYNNQTESWSLLRYNINQY
jgi:hypothetical protein